MALTSSLATSTAVDQCAGVKLLVEVPFTVADVPLILRTHKLWSRYMPCANPTSAATTGLLFLFNKRCAESSACSQVEKLVQLSAHSRCFGDIRVQDAKLTSREDVYDKHRRSAKWVAGPNNLFYRALANARRHDYTHMLQVEPDVVPFRAGWLDRARCLAAFSEEAWVIGSALVANCTLEETTGQCVSLPEEIAEHINGNAIYAAGDAGFASFLQATRHGQLGRMAYDVALHVSRSRLEQPARRRLLHRFQHSSFVLNLGTSAPDNAMALRQAHPGAFLVHSSAVARLDLESHFPPSAAVEEAAARPAARKLRSEAAASHLGDDKGSDEALLLDLGPLYERALPLAGARVAMVTFVAGRRYLALCRNHVQHLRRAGVTNYVLVVLDAASLQWARAEAEPTVDATRLVNGLPADGADKFGSSAFFAVNGARYRALLAMLQAGISLFVLDRHPFFDA